jgi:hypothetical protein
LQAVQTNTNTDIMKTAKKNDSVQASNVQANNEEQVKPAEIVTPQAEIVTLPQAPSKLILSGGYKPSIAVLQRQLDTLSSLGGRIKQVAKLNEEKLEALNHQEQAKRAQASGKIVSVPRAKSDIDGTLSVQGLPSTTKLALMVKLELVKADDAAKLKKLVAFSEALYNVMNA